MTNPISNNLLWIAQGILAFIFIGASIMKLSQPREKLIQKLTPLAEFSQQQIRLIGLAEFLGVLGLILPVATGILPILTPIAALCLAVLMLGAIRANIQVKHSFVPSAVALVLSLIVAWGRWV